MKWSKLKKRIEDGFADSVRGRVEVLATRYRDSHDAAGEVWVTIDGNKVFGAADFSYYKEHGAEAARFERNGAFPSGSDAQRREEITDRELEHRGVVASWSAMGSLFDYLNMSIDAILSSDDGVIRAFGMLDRRVGKRRLADLSDDDGHPLVVAFRDLRLSAEGMTAKR